jgi:hypothetical protein
MKGPPMVTELYYRERAEEARVEADAANLANVRDRCLRSAEAWDVMAARIGRTTRLRAATEAKKAAEREALLAVS